MARISLDPPQTLGYRLGARVSRRRYGVMVDPAAAMGHNMTAIIAVENLRSRINSALGLTAQGFKDRCELPVAAGQEAARGRGD